MGGQFGKVFALWLSLGGLDLTILNLVVVPALLTATDVSPARAALEPTGAVVEFALPSAENPAVVSAHAGAFVTSAGDERPALQPTAAPHLQAQLWFRTGKWQLERDARMAALTAVELARGAETTIEVIGHADSRGTRQFNQHLSRLRAHAVASFLMRHGIERERITAHGVGEDENSAQPHARRVDVWTGGAP
jgi:outer membrane protein OmpA-like peptidoglycan-associated protein